MPKENFLEKTPTTEEFVGIMKEASDLLTETAIKEARKKGKTKEEAEPWGADDLNPALEKILSDFLGTKNLSNNDDYEKISQRLNDFIFPDDLGETGYACASVHGMINYVLNKSLNTNLLNNFLSAADTEKNEHLDQIIKKLSNPDSYKSMKEAIDSKNNSALTTTISARFKENYKKILNAAKKQESHIEIKYQAALRSSRKNTKNSNAIDINSKSIQTLLAQKDAIKREIAALESPRENSETDLDYYRNRIIDAYASLTKIRSATNGKKYTDLKTITENNSRATAAFKTACLVVATALVLPILFILMQMHKSKIFQGNSSFWNTKDHDLKKSVQEVEKDLDLGLTSKKLK